MYRDVSAKSRCLRRFRAVILALLVAGPVAAQSDGDGQDSAPPVTVVTAAKRDFVQAAGFSGRIEAIEKTDLRARVQGYLESRDFEEGSLVKKDTLLFQLDDKVYRNALDQAKASLGVSEANRKLAQQQFDRQKELTDRNVQSRAKLDEAQANLDISIADIASAKARVEEAQINLGYTKITAPFTGQIGRAQVSRGDLISPSSGVMAKIVQVDPIYISFPVPQAKYLEVQKMGGSAGDVFVALTLADGSEYKHHGKILFTAVSSTASTDSIIVRALVDNPDNTLIDEGLVEVSVVSNEDASVLAIPQQSILVDQQGSYVLVADKDDKVKQVRVEPGRQQDGYLEITSGLKEGDRVITEGIQKIRPGIKVAPSTADESSN